MIQLRFDQLAKYCEGTLNQEDLGAVLFHGVSIDTRTLNEKELFIAIKGEQQDGHMYLQNAIEKGASGILADKSSAQLKTVEAEIPVVAVKNSHQAMLALAKVYRDSLNTKFIGITGSNGKTTTKELTFSLLQAVEKNVFKTPGNLNNLYGVPLTLFSIDKNCKAGVLELGISTIDEMPKLAEITHPDVVVITNVGISHLEFLTSVQAVAQAKLELIKNAPKHVPLIVNADDVILVEEAEKIRDSFLTFSITHDADFSVKNIVPQKNGANLVTINTHEFILPLIGKHQIANLTAAYASVSALGYSFDHIDTKKITFDTAPMRGQILSVGSMLLVSDCYNANPDSMKAGLKAFFEMKSDKRRVLILGDMLELGTEEKMYHEQIGEFLLDKQFDLLITVGIRAKEISKICNANGIKTVEYGDSKALSEDIHTLVDANDFVYIKASRGVGLEKVLHTLQASGEEA